VIKSIFVVFVQQGTGTLPRHSYCPPPQQYAGNYTYQYAMFKMKTAGSDKQPPVAGYAYYNRKEVNIRENNGVSGENY
jgi:hypothetical protein